jgi:hypothetical protein
MQGVPSFPKAVRQGGYLPVFTVTFYQRAKIAARPNLS